jgi:hypothetical protein
VAAINASKLPSPPSANGQVCTCALGAARCTPRAIAAAASWALSASLKLSGQSNTFIGTISTKQSDQNILTKTFLLKHCH